MDKTIGLLCYVAAMLLSVVVLELGPVAPTLEFILTAGLVIVGTTLILKGSQNGKPTR